MSKLYIVATPIGNLEDITLRALRILREVDFILCEDTRVTKKLLSKYEITTQTISYHQHSGEVKTNKIIELLKKEKSLALVTDAGTPGISDPGNKLITDLIKEIGGGVEVIPIPGPSALSASLSISGFPTDQFLFLGFLPHKKGRQTMINEIARSKQTVIVYESCHRIEKFLEQLLGAGGQNLKLTVCRELTKMFESIYRGSPTQVLQELQFNKKNLKGEFVVVISHNA
ncbi:MAG: 16S rRNA (cytidine(1402)-2'-O)-methyltransferase [Patescibacteria group bacterium]|jgi:16S rRNA (cytidine1402-2'-O)-methyltransferase